MKKIAALLIVLLPLLVSSQNDTLKTDTVSNWKHNGLYALNLSQVSLVNWAAGGENLFSVNSFLNYTLNYNKSKINWENTLNLAYGIVKQGERPLNKSDDRIEINSRFGKRISKNWKHIYMLTFRTQFDEGFKNPGDSLRISKFMAPGYVISSIGFNYSIKDKFSVTIAPISNKITFVADPVLANQGAFGVTPALYDTNGNLIKNGSLYRIEFGGNLRIFYSDEIVKNVTLTSTIDFFSNYLEKPENIDINWDFMLSMKVNKLLSANLNMNLIYDDDINIGKDTTGDGNADKFGPRTQFKSVFGAGLSIKLN
jgi:hypothetical protein